MRKSKPNQFGNVLGANTTSASTHNDHMSMPKTCDVRRGHFGKIRGVLLKRPVRAWWDVEPSFGASEAYTHFATITKDTNITPDITLLRIQASPYGLMK